MARKPSLLQLLEEQRDRFDELIGQVNLGVRHQRHFDDLEEAAQAIGRAIPAAFRNGART